MVALTKKSAKFPQGPLRVRAQDHRYRLGAKWCSKSNCQADLREATYDECDRLESCSKDPIGYGDGLNRYTAYFVPGNVDPSGRIAIEPQAPKSGFLGAGCCRVDIWDSGVGKKQKTGNHATVSCSSGLYASFYPGDRWENPDYDNGTDENGNPTTPPKSSITLCCLNMNAMETRFKKLKQTCVFDGVVGYVCTSVVSELLFVGSKDNDVDCPCGKKPKSLFGPDGGIPGWDTPANLECLVRQLESRNCEMNFCVDDGKYHPPTTCADPTPWGYGPKY